MSTTLLMLCTLVWLPVLVYHIDRRGFLILLIWLFVAPVASNLVNEPGTNPFFKRHRSQEVTLVSRQAKRSQKLAYTTSPTTVRLRDLFEPTRLLFCAFFGVLLLDMILKKRIVPLDRVETWMLVFSAILIIGTFRSTRFAYSMRIAVDAFIVPFLAYAVCRRLVTSEERLHRLIQVVIYVALYQIVIALIERLMSPGLYYRLETTFRNQFSLSFIMTMIFLFMFTDILGRAIFPGESSVFQRAGRGVALCLAPVIIALTWTRGNWVAFLLSIGVFLFLGRRCTNHTRKLALIGSTLIILSIIAVVLQTPVSESIIQERITQRTGTIYARLGVWKLLIQKDASVFGIGFNDTRSTLGTLRIKFMGIKSETHPHNSFLALFSELGVVGLLGYLAIVISVIRMGRRWYREGSHAREQWLGVIVISSMVAYLVPALFANTLYLTALSNVYMWGIVGGVAGVYGGQRLLVSSLSTYTRPPLNARVGGKIPGRPVKLATSVRMVQCPS